MSSPEKDDFAQSRKIDAPMGDGNISYINVPGQITMPKLVLFIYVPVMILASCIGIVGNVLVVGAVVKRKQLRILLNVFIVNLAIADLMVSMLVNPAAVVGVLDMGNLFRQFPVVCEVLSTFCVISFVGSLWSLSFVALNRYIYICHRYYYPKIYTSRSVTGMVAFIWIFALLLDLPNYLGWGDHTFDFRNFTCCYNYSANFAYTRGFLFVFGFVVPVGLLNYSYIRVCILARKSANKLAARHRDRAPSWTQRHRVWDATDTRLLQTVGAIWIVFMIMWIPYATCVVFDLGDISGLFIPATLMAFMNSSVNFMIYASNRNFRKGYRMIFKGLCCSRKVATEVSSIENTSKGASYNLNNFEHFKINFEAVF